jgi:uncharacterized circularly permuted ATP-grasp superfamily protein
VVQAIVFERDVALPTPVQPDAASSSTPGRCADGLRDDPWRVDPVGDLCRALRAVGDHPVVLTDGPSNSAFYEHRVIARELQAPLVTLDDLDVCDDGIYLDGERLDVVYRRTDIDAMVDACGRPSPVSEALAEPWLRGQIRLLNGFGVGVADDKLAHAYVEHMVGFYLGEEPLLPSLPTHDPSEPRVLDEALSRLDQIVVKPRSESGGCQGTDVKAVPGGLSRFAQQPGALVVNSSQGGGAKDTWVVS